MRWQFFSVLFPILFFFVSRANSQIIRNIKDDGAVVTDGGKNAIIYSLIYFISLNWLLVL